MTEDEMAGWHHQLVGHGFEWTLGVGDGQGGLACCDSGGRKESDTTEQLNNNNTSPGRHFHFHVFIDSEIRDSVQFSSVQSLSRIRLSVFP